MKTKECLIHVRMLGAILLCTAASTLSAQTIQNSDFETPYVGPPGTSYDWDTYYSFEYNPIGAVWIFAGNAGIAANGSGFAFYNSGTPSGNQFAFIQNLANGGGGGSMSQTISNCPAGNYTFTFIASQRDIVGRDNTQNQGVMVSVDGGNVGSFTPADTNWYSFQTTPIALNAGNHVLTFTNLSAIGDIRIDTVGLQSSPLTTLPSLGIAPDGNQSVLFWPASATSVVLQTTTNLSSPNWVTVSNGTSFTAIGFTNLSPAQFFRLH